MIYKLANNFSYDSKEDLYQVGIIGLINAYKRFDNNLGIKFSTYAYSFILGEMKKYIRENNGINISRDIIYLSKRLDRLIEILANKNNKYPTTSELADILEVSEWKVIEALGIRNCIRSLDEYVNDNEKISYIDTIMVKDDIDYIEFNDMLNTLSDTERKIINEKYFYDKSQLEIANNLGYSQAKVSREEKKILKKLKNYYKV
jgi:RNA polymerase sigma factor (sigma-70 family)